MKKPSKKLKFSLNAVSQFISLTISAGNFLEFHVMRVEGWLHFVCKPAFVKSYSNQMKAFRKLKKSQPLMRSLVVLLTVILTPDFSHAQCVDGNVNTSNTNFATGNLANSFVADCSGNLTSVELQWGGADAAFSIRLFENGGTGGTQVGSTVTGLSSVGSGLNSWESFNVSSGGFSVTSGNTYTVEVVSANNIIYDQSGGTTYSEGVLYFNGGTQSTLDMVFKVNITPAASNTAPTASSVSFSGTLEVGEVLTGTYTYADADSDPESGSAYQWFRSDDNAGTNKASISGATSQTYTLQATDANKYISFAVTPNDGTDAGTTVESALNGSVACIYPAGSSAYTEDFEAIPVSGTSFTHASTNIEFYTTDHLGVSTISNAGINGSDRFLDNLGSCLSSPGKVGSITTNGVADFYVHDFWLFPSENCYNVGTNGTVIIRGKKSSSTVFSKTIQSSDLNSNSGVNKGFTFIDMSDYECFAIDELEFEVTGNLDYIAIDDFSFTATPINVGVLLASSPTLSFTSTSGLSDFIAEDGEGGSQSISDIDIQVYNISDVNGTLENSMTWRSAGWLGSSDGSYSGLTDAANDGSKGMLIKSKDGSEFSLTQFEYYNWGESSSFVNTVKGYRDNAEVTSTTFSGFNSNYDPILVNPGSNFNNVDEVRLFISAGGYVGDQSATNHSINNIQVSTPIAAPLSVSASVDDNVTCNGDADGGATATALDGTAPYTYSWSNGASTASISGVVAGTYTVTVTDNVGGTATASATVTQPTALVASSVVDSNASCNGNSDGGATAAATGGTLPYTYAWSNGATTSSITGISAGTYTVTVTDNSGCTSTASTAVTHPAALVASTTVNNDVSCNGASDGELGCSGSGGTFPYTYSWSNGGTTASQVSLPAGTYTVTITDNNGCTATSSKTITSPAALDAGEIQ